MWSSAHTQGFKNLNLGEAYAPPPQYHAWSKGTESEEASGKKVWEEWRWRWRQRLQEKIAIPAPYKLAVASHPLNTMGNCNASGEIAGTSTMHLSIG